MARERVRGMSTRSTGGGPKRAANRPTVLLACEDRAALHHRAWALRAVGFQVVVTPLGLRAAEQIIATHTRLQDLEGALVYVCDEPNSGLVLVWALRQNHPSLPIVVVTTWDDRTVIDELLEHELWVVLEQGVPTEVAVATMLNAVPARGGHTQVAV